MIADNFDNEEIATPYCCILCDIMLRVRDFFILCCEMKLSYFLLILLTPLMSVNSQIGPLHFGSFLANTQKHWA